MKRLVALLAASALVVIVVPAWAAKPPHPTHPSHPAHGKGHRLAKGHGKSKGSCKMLTEGYSASGTLTSATLTPATGKNRFDGTVAVDITRANHRGLKGSQTFTLADTRVRFGKGVSPTAPAAGDGVTAHGKLAVPQHGCTGSPQVTSVRNIRIQAPRD